MVNRFNFSVWSYFTTNLILQWNDCPYSFQKTQQFVGYGLGIDDGLGFHSLCFLLKRGQGMGSNFHAGRRFVFLRHETNEPYSIFSPVRKRGNSFFMMMSSWKHCSTVIVMESMTHFLLRIRAREQFFVCMPLKHIIHLLDFPLCLLNNTMNCVVGFCLTIASIMYAWKEEKMQITICFVSTNVRVEDTPLFQRSCTCFARLRGRDVTSAERQLSIECRHYHCEK